MRFDHPTSIIELAEYHRDIARRMEDDARAKQFDKITEYLSSLRDRKGIDSPAFRRAAAEFQKARVRHLKSVMTIANRGHLRWAFYLSWVLLAAAIACAFLMRGQGIVGILVAFGLILGAAVLRIMDLRQCMPRLSSYINELMGHRTG